VVVVGHIAATDPPQADVAGRVGTLEQQRQSRQSIKTRSGPDVRGYVQGRQQLSGLWATAASYCWRLFYMEARFRVEARQDRRAGALARGDIGEDEAADVLGVPLRG
jgi:hypothetical protein